MASIFRKHGKWYVKVKQVDGRWVPRPTTASTKSEAKGLALELERRVERQHLGREALPTDCTLTFGQLVQWWLDTYSKPTSSHSRNESYARRHLPRPSEGRAGRGAQKRQPALSAGDDDQPLLRPGHDEGRPRGRAPDR